MNFFPSYGKVQYKMQETMLCPEIISQMMLGLRI